MSDYEEVREMYELSASEGVQAIVEAADERITALGAELATEREHPTSILQCAACQRLAVVRNAQLKAENARLRLELSSAPRTREVSPRRIAPRGGHRERA